MSGFIVSKDKPIGDYIALYLARSKIERAEGYERGRGGAVTALLIYLLDKKIIDAVIVTKKTRGLEGEIIVAKTREDLLEAAGTRWSVLPYTAKLRESLMEEDIQRVAIVGLPCQAQFLRQMQLYPLLETDFSKKISLIISLFCMGTYASEAFIAFLKRVYKLNPEDIIDIQLRGDTLYVKMPDEEKTIPTQEILPYVQLGCLICPDYTGIFSDISAGLSEVHLGYTVLIARNKNAVKIIQEAEDAGYIETKPGTLDIVEEVKFRAEAKLIRAVKYASMLL